MCTIVKTKIHHAAHYVGHPERGHDLIQLDVTDTDWSPGKPRPESAVAIGAEYHSGYRDKDGKQHWVFNRRIPMGEGTCERCAP